MTDLIIIVWIVFTILIGAAGFVLGVIFQTDKQTHQLIKEVFNEQKEQKTTAPTHPLGGLDNVRQRTKNGK